MSSAVRNLCWQYKTSHFTLLANMKTHKLFTRSNIQMGSFGQIYKITVDDF